MISVDFRSLRSLAAAKDDYVLFPLPGKTRYLLRQKLQEHLASTSLLLQPLCFLILDKCGRTRNNLIPSTVETNYSCEKKNLFQFGKTRLILTYMHQYAPIGDNYI